MRPDTLSGWVRSVPFQSFRLHLTSGEAFDVRHPDAAMVQRDRVTITLGGSGGAGPSRQIDVSLLHIIYIEPIPVTPSPSAN